MCNKLIFNQSLKKGLAIILSPFIFTTASVFAIAIFNLGNYAGTFARYLYHIVVR